MAAVRVVRRRLADLVAALRAEGLPVSVAESLDAAAAAGAIGFARSELRDALAATLVKDEADRGRFERYFDRFFPAAAPAPAMRGTRRDRTAGAGEGDGTSAAGASGSGGAAAAAPGEPAASTAAGAAQTAGAASPPETPSAPSAEHADLDPARRTPSPRGARVRTTADPVAGNADTAVPVQQRRSALLAMPFREMTARDVAEADALVRLLARRVHARFRRRRQPRVRGRLDFRRTIRAAIAHGGAFVERRFRGRRPGRPALVALVDCSKSAATATDFFLALLAPSFRSFRSVRLFGYVDRLVEIEAVDGQIRPAGRLDLMARSDFGRVLGDLATLAGDAPMLGPDTVLLVLGDARNNRRPPRVDLLAAARARVRRLVWLNPEPRTRWDTGDSVMAVYMRIADAVVPCGSLAELDAALAVVARL